MANKGGRSWRVYIAYECSIRVKEYIHISDIRVGCLFECIRIGCLCDCMIILVYHNRVARIHRSMHWDSRPQTDSTAHRGDDGVVEKSDLVLQHVSDTK